MSAPEGFPTKFESPIPIENSNQTSLIGASAFCIIFPTLMVTLRMVAKIKSTKKFNASDACILVALFFNTALHADVFIMVVHGGFGFHVQDIATRFGPEVLTLFFKCIMVFALLWNATTCFTKLSVLLMYMSVFPVRRVVLPCQVLGVFIILWNIGGVLGGILVCRPLAMNWDQTIPGGKCGNQPMYYMWLGIINIIVEVTMLALPMPVLYKLQMPLRKKIVIISMFGIGFATCAITIYRQATLPALQFADMTHSGVVATLLSGLEPSVALALACVPFLRPLFGTVFGTTQNKSSPATGDYRKGSKRSVTREFEELDDNSSEVQLQPVMPIREALVTSDPKKRDRTAKPDTITVETGWEVNVKRDSGGAGLK
ncbi:integral membrane protein [Plectosphaerella plurivora]|uniref:Integral membrane protein n=1 Tax=Plectosphaerella plurivora TaxID=936078 RepID=A0A9P9A8U6_9PEZI|nr:integral membrane protein [Plectosphaerella plurivora]